MELGDCWCSGVLEAWADMFYIGVDLGQKHDYTAIAVVEKENARLMNQTRIYSALPPAPAKLLVRRLERVALGTSYPKIVEHIRGMTHEPALAGRCALVVDATGLGAPVVDMLREPGAAIGCDITAVTITGGERVSRRGLMHFGVPRRDLLAGVRVAIEKGLLRFGGKLEHTPTLVRELLALRADSDTSEHDDMVFAVALACWRADRKSVWGGGRLPGL